MSACGLLVLVLANPARANCVVNYHMRPADTMSDEVNKLFEEKNYARLNALARQYERAPSTTADGNSSLMAFYRGILQSFSPCGRTKHTDEEWTAHLNGIEAWIAASGTLTAPKLARALTTIDYAWYARGYGTVSTVDDSAWPIFAKRLALARKQMEALASVSKKNPAWYAGMLNLALAQGRKPAEFDALYKKAVALDPYYLEVHHTKANFYSSKWYGSPAQQGAAIEQSAELTKAKLGRSMYTQLHWFFSRSPDIFKNGDVDWEKMKAGFDDMLKIYPDARTRDNYAMFACQAGDGKTLKQQFEVLGDLNPATWTDAYFNSYCKALAKHSDTGEAPRCFTRADTGQIYCE